jgi:ketosteroid isomerase-like protein
MATQRTIEEADIRRQMERWCAAIRAMALDGVTSTYARDIASFDVGPPLRHAGAEAKMDNWAGVVAMFQPPLDYEIRDLTITVGDDVAFGHSLNRISSTSKDGKKKDIWVRFRRASGRSTTTGSSCTTTSRSPLIPRPAER